MEPKCLVLVVFMVYIGDTQCQETKKSIPNKSAPDMRLSTTRNGFQQSVNPYDGKKHSRTGIQKIKVGQKFVGPPSDGRTSDVLGFNVARGLPSSDPVGPVPITKGGNVSPVEATIPLIKVGRKFVGPPSDGRTSDVLGFNVARGLPSNDPVGPAPEAKSGTVFPAAPSLPLIPLPGFPSISQNGYHRSNQQKMTESERSRTGLEGTKYFPIEITYKKPTVGNAARTYCQFDDTGNMYIDVRAEGLNYFGVYDNYAIIDARRPVSTAMVSIAVNIHVNATSEVLLTAWDSCGRQCQARCLEGIGALKMFRDCDGIARVRRRHTTFGIKFMCPMKEQSNRYFQEAFDLFGW